ncbi:hypothetical protein [Nocardia acidivorans]|uniref:hypothetical protein n=1 Tax=Nocardia acidivorans TaxID=404580 RepID=UPI000A6D6577|nr:hypothetical protein [Nocardia acidivorans]
MTAVWLPFLIGLTTGIASAWFLTTIPAHGRSPSAEGWTVAAITSRLEREHQPGGGLGEKPRPSTPSRHRRAHPGDRTLTS